MFKAIKYILKVFDRSNKKQQIKSSGSIKGNRNERVRSGQSYLYKCKGMESEVFEVRFKTKVTGAFLREAVRYVLMRYEYMNAKMVELDGDFYIVRNDNSLVITKTSQLPKLGSMANSYHLISVTYWRKSIYVSFHHALCDGRGIKPFIESLIFYYCKMKYRSQASSEGIRLYKDSLLEGETTEPFAKAYEYDSTKKFPNISKEGFAIPENLEKNANTSYRYELTLPVKEFMEVCKKNNATPTILVSLILNKTIAKLYPNYDKPIHANIATDMRDALGVPNTFKNCVKSMVLPYDKDYENLSLKEQATKYRELLALQRDVDYCKREANTMLGLFDKLDTLPSLEEKRKIMSFFENMILNSYVISYIGQFVLNENEKYVDSIHLYNSGVIGLGINMICVSGKFIFDFKQSFTSDKYLNGFVDSLKEFGIPYERSGIIAFETPKDLLIRRK